MGLRSLSISSSESRRGLARRWSFLPLLAIVGWAIIGLAAIDAFIGVAFRYPSDPTAMPSRPEAFFEYGRSAEGAFKRMTRPDRARTAPITLSGWYEPLVATGSADQQVTSSSSQPSKPVVTIYGGSHSVRLAQALGRVTDDLAWRSIGAPGATSNWSYGAFLRDRMDYTKSSAVVLTFNTNLLPSITSFSPAMWNYDAPSPYTADRFYLDRGKLKVLHPPYDSFAEYERTLSNPKAWSRAVEFFAKNDPLFNAISFRSNVLEHSALIRLVRRAHNSERFKTNELAVLDRSNFRQDSEAVQVGRAIIQAFAARARADGKVPIIFLVNDLGYSDVLFRALKPAMDSAGVAYVSSHQFVSSSDPSGYLPDGHFTDANDDRLAAELERIVVEFTCNRDRLTVTAPTAC